MPIERYGLRFPDQATAADVELVCFNRNWQPEQGGLGRFGHLQNAIDLIWNEPRRRYAAERKQEYDPDKHDAFIWNEWTELMMRSFCEEKEVIVAGPGASWKTTCMALYFLCFWLCSPHNTRVILTSTTGDGLRARIWKELTHFYRAVAGIGNLVQSRTMIQTVKGDDGAGIFGIAVESDGNVEKAVNKIVGRHNTNIGVGIDEMPTVSGAIVEGAVNLETGAQRFELKGVGNPDSRFDPHGKMAEPVKGWDSISVDTRTWRAKSGAYVIHLYGPDSPKIRFPENFPGLINQQDIDKTAARYGENSPQMWKQRFGFWAPEGLTKTVLSETMILKFKAKEKAIWVSGYYEVAALDPAFEGGDRCVLGFGRIGMIDGGQTALELREKIVIKVDVTAKEDTVHYQIMRAVKMECEKRTIPPKHFAMDTSGEGGGLASIISREWGSDFLQVEFGGRASDRPISDRKITLADGQQEAAKPASKEYLYRVTELWFGFQTILQQGQIRGLDDETAIEFCKRLWEMVGNLIMIESKTKMKSRTGRSPDFADETVVMCELFRKLEGSNVAGGGSDTRSDKWREIAKEFDVTNDYASDEAEEYAGFGG